LGALQNGQTYTLQSSSNLTEWAEVTTIAATNSTQQWSASVGSSSREFFRLKW